MMITGIGDWTFWAWLSSAFAVLASVKRAELEPLEDLTYRLQHPVKWRLEHPVRAVRRMFR